MGQAPDSVIGHWSTFVEGLHEPPLEFYTGVEGAVAKRNIADVTFARIEYREGGAFSGFRLYLRISRHREVFDVCAAPFGNGCFFSWWLAEVRPEMPGLATMFVIFFYLAVVGAFVHQFGFFQGPIILLFLVPIGLFVVSLMGTPQADDVILMLPIIGKLYERFFRPITYYRMDTSDMFQLSVKKSVEEVLDQVTATKGLRPLTELERKPVMRDFFKR